MDSATFISLSRDIQSKLKFAHSAAWFAGSTEGGARVGECHILSTSLRVKRAHPFFTFPFCRYTWLAGNISSPIFRHLARVQPGSKFSDRFTEGSAPTYANGMLTGHHVKWLELGGNVYPVILEERQKSSLINQMFLFVLSHQTKKRVT